MGKKADKRVFKESERQKLKLWRQTRGSYDPATGKPPSLGSTSFGKSMYKKARKGKTSKKASY
jgi:hypothetical protein